MVEAQQESAKARYDTLAKDRWQFLQRGRANAMLTIPSLMPLEGHDGKAHLIEPYQGLGSAGTVSLTSRLALALIPAGRPHLRLDVDNKILMELDGEIPVKVNQQLSKSEKLIQNAVEKANWRSATLGTVAQLIVCGSATEFMFEDGTIRTFRLDQFVWSRDHRGRVVECIILERFNKNALPAAMRGKTELGTTNTEGSTKDDEVELFTVIRFKVEDGTYEVHKEDGAGLKVGKTEVFEEKKLPYLFLRWSEMPGEDYGRSKVEEVIADLRSLDGLEKGSIEQGAMASKNFIMVRPGANAAGLRNRITRVNNGDVVLGDPESVELKQFASPGGYQITGDQIERIGARVARAFLLQTPTQRNAERVTATEIERDIQELESTLGGTFSVLSLEMMERRTLLLMDFMKKRGEFPQTEDGALNITILTGLEALSRERDIARGQQMAQIASLFGEQGIRRLNLGNILGKVAVGLGFPDAIRDEEEVQAEIQQEQQAEQLKAAAPNAVKALTEGGASGGGG